MADDGHRGDPVDTSDPVSETPVRYTDGRTGGNRSRILLAIDREPNREQLASWLSERYDVETVGDGDVTTALGRCDLCIVDGVSFRRHRKELSDSKDAAEPVFFPHLLVRTDDRRSDPADDPWETVDDVIGTPIRKAELRGRIEVLLRARQYSIDLEQQNDRLERFADIVVHDLRNPLTIAKGFLELARDSGDPDHFGRIGRSLDRMQEIIDDMLALARTGTAIEGTEPVDLAVVAKTAWETVETHDVTLEVEDGLTLLGDESRVVVLFENLFRNAVEHAGRDATVRIGTLAGAGGFYVEDDGPGVPEDRRAEVFDYGHTTADDGTGFGLAIVRGIVDAHGWSVRLTEGREGGARFEIVCEGDGVQASPTDATGEFGTD